MCCIYREKKKAKEKDTCSPVNEIPECHARGGRGGCGQGAARAGPAPDYQPTRPSSSPRGAGALLVVGSSRERYVSSLLAPEVVGPLLTSRLAAKRGLRRGSRGCGLPSSRADADRLRHPKVVVGGCAPAELPLPFLTFSSSCAAPAARG